MNGLLLGVDIGTSSSKGVLARPDGEVVATAQREHALPRPGWAEHDAEEVWWADFLAICAELLPQADGPIAAVCTSGIGPCLLPADEGGRPLRPAILYGIDTRATREIEELNERYGEDILLTRCGSVLTTQAVGPKLLWLRRNEPDVWEKNRQFFMANSFIAWRLTGEYVLDHHSASQCDPLYDVHEYRWIDDWAEEIAPGLPLPRLLWPAEVVGEPRGGAGDGNPGRDARGGRDHRRLERRSKRGSAEPGRPDAYVRYDAVHHRGARRAALSPRSLGHDRSSAGDPQPRRRDGDLWGAYRLAQRDLRRPAIRPAYRGGRGRPAGIRRPRRAAVLRRGTDAALRPSGARPDLRPHSKPRTGASLPRYARGDRLRGKAHLRVHAGGRRKRGEARGGGRRYEGGLWTQIVSDVTGRPQDLPEQTIGASYGDALLAARSIGLAGPDTDWTRVLATVEPEAENRQVYDELYRIYRGLYPVTREQVHKLADMQRVGGEVVA